MARSQDPDEIARELAEQVPNVYDQLSVNYKGRMIQLVIQWRKLGGKGGFIPDGHAYWEMIYLVACYMLVPFGGVKVTSYKHHFANMPAMEDFLRGWQRIASMSDVNPLRCKGSQAFLVPQGKTRDEIFHNQQRFLRELYTVVNTLEQEA